MISRKSAVGDILGYFFDDEGRVIPEMKIHDELIGLTLNTLKTIPTVIDVAGGVNNKAEAIAAAMKGAISTHWSLTRKLPQPLSEGSNAHLPGRRAAGVTEFPFVPWRKH